MHKSVMVSAQAEDYIVEFIRSLSANEDPGSDHGRIISMDDS